VHLDGTLKNGVIQAVENIPGPDVYTFVATARTEQPLIRRYASRAG